MEAAVRHEYANRNPVKLLAPAQRPRPERKEAAYFENAELPKLFAELPGGAILVFSELALKTGMRQGEIVGLQWGDVDLTSATVRVRRSITDGHVSTPKNHERRDVDLTSDVVELLGRWWGETGSPEASGAWLFPGEAKHGLLGMRERAELLDGTVEITSAPGTGTIVGARLPVRRR
jgi:integrase